MSELKKIEIRLITPDGHPGEWQWMGKLTESDLKRLCSIADALCGFSVEEAQL